MTKILGIIPSRAKSSRFPNKPLADIHGKPMVWWTYTQAKKVAEFDDLVVATESDEIMRVCKSLDIPAIMTADTHATGTDRLAEVSSRMPADIYVNVQGDEPIIEPEVIRAAIPPLLNDTNVKLTCLMTAIDDPVEVVNITVPKVITNVDNRCVFMTRAAAPAPKGSIGYKFYKQTCVYGFRPEALDFFRTAPRGKMEKIEDIELLRFVEAGWHLQMVEVNATSVAVDTQLDLEKVRELMVERKMV